MDTLKTSPGREDRDLDKIDRRILRVLQADGRISNLKLAEEVHLSPTAVLERVKRLHREGFILGYEARLNPARSWAPGCWCSWRSCSTARCTT
jgi:Lrp/AsnC family leucine-responsive transcriptional regulator